MPGGGVEFGESIREAVTLEVFEETSYRVEAGRVLAGHHFTAAALDGRRRYDRLRPVGAGRRGDGA